jgi:hypothetical protein
MIFGCSQTQQVKGGEMHRQRQALVAFGAVVILVLFGGSLLGKGEGVAQAQTYDFTYTSDDTVESGIVDDTAGFQALLTNTGTAIDSYLVTMTKSPTTPGDWTWELCAGGVCEDMMTQAVAYLESGWEDPQFLNVALASAGQGKFTITVESYGNPGTKLTKSITFLMSAYEQGPVTDLWGMIVLVTLIVASGLYLMHRRLRLARQRRA